jgi:hypothetical protein
MTISKERRASITKAQKITDAIVNKFVEEKSKKKSVDLVNLAKNLAERREKVLTKGEA